jgi:hypothetical protein
MALFSQIDKLDDVAGTLEELWISYNQIKSLDGLVRVQILKDFPRRGSLTRLNSLAWRG